MNTVCLGQNEGDKYAHPDGEDAYGNRYEAREAPTEMKVHLDVDGEYVLPSFIDLTINREATECWVTEQIPAAGTVYTGPQTVVVQLKHICGNNEEYWARLPVEIKDITPPEVVVMLDSNATPPKLMCGVQRYVATAAVLPLVS